MKRLLAFALMAAVGVASTACGSSAEGQPAGGVAADDNLIEGEEVMANVVENFHSTNPSATGIGSWDMIAVRREGHEYYVFAGYADKRRSSDLTLLEVIFEKVSDGVRVQPRAADGGTVTLDDSRRAAVMSDIEAMLKSSPEAAPTTTSNCRKVKLAIPIKVLLKTVEVISGLGCIAFVWFVPMVGIPSCLAAVATLQLERVLEDKTSPGCH